MRPIIDAGAGLVVLPLLIGLIAAVGGCAKKAPGKLPEKPVVSAAVRMSGDAAARRTVEQAVAQAHTMLMAAHARQNELCGMAGWSRVTNLAMEVATIESDLATGDVARAYDRSTSWKLRSLRQRVADDALTAVPFLVLGPFRDARFASLSELDATNRAAYLQIPYLHEFRAEKDGTLNWKWLVKDLRPDRARRYPACGSEQSWLPAFKTNALVLDHWNTGKDWTVLYLYTEIYSPEVREGALLFRESENLGGMGCWLNGNWFCGVVGSFYEYGGRGNLKLSSGWNSLLLKVIQRGGGRLTLTIVHGWTHADTTPMYDVGYRIPAATNQVGVGNGAGRLN